MHRSLFSDLFGQNSSSDELLAADKASWIIYRSFEYIYRYISPGITTLSIAEKLEDFLLYNKSDNNIIISVSPEEIVWHGIPGSRKLKEGELVTIDVALTVRGHWADCSWTFPSGEIDETHKNLILASWMGLHNVIDNMKPGENGKNIFNAVSRICRETSVFLVSEGAGHGIGRKLHEPPVITYDGRLHEPLKKNFLYTAEPVFKTGSEGVLISDEGNAVTSDGNPAAYFEMPVLVLEHGVHLPGEPPMFLFENLFL